MNLTIVTKGGHKEGMGDVTSSLSLALELSSRNCLIRFIINDNSNVIDLLKSHSFSYQLAETRDEIETLNMGDNQEGVILNQLNTPPKVGRVFKKKFSKMITIDDTGETAQLADLRFNPLYPIENSYSDLKYVPLGKTFTEKKFQKEIPEHARKIVIMQGGSDTYGFTPLIMKSLFTIEKKITIQVILGPNFSHHSELEKVLSESPRDFDLLKGLTDISEIIFHADLIITAGGISLFESLCLGVPAIVVCAETFENITASRCEDLGLCKNLGFGKNCNEIEIFKNVNYLLNNPILREQMSERGRSLVDGKGAVRIARKIIEYFQN